VGAIPGFESHSMILVLNTDEVLAQFTSGKHEWEFGIDASIAVAKHKERHHILHF
jgi:lipid-binding SYLF domain-containing protein